MCDLSNACVLAVITDPNNFTDPSGIAFSQPFYIASDSDDAGTPAGRRFGSGRGGHTVGIRLDGRRPVRPHVPADGQNASTITVTLRLSSDLPVSGKTVSSRRIRRIAR